MKAIYKVENYLQTSFFIKSETLKMNLHQIRECGKISEKIIH